MLLFVLSCVQCCQYILGCYASLRSVLCPMLPVYLGLLCFSSFCVVSNVASISWVVMLLFVLSCVQCCQYILGCYASLRSVLCPMLPVYLGLLCFSSFCLVSNVASISWAVMLLFVLCCVQCCQYILGCYASLRSVLCPMLPVYLGLLCFSSFCLVSNVASISWVVMLLFVLSCVQCCQYILGCYASLRSVLCPMLPVYLGLLCFSSFCLVSNVASISWVVMLLFVLSCVQCCQYILGCYASLRSVLCPMLPVYLGLLCFSSFCVVSNVASISWVVMLLFVLSCVQCCQYILGCYASLRSVLCPMLPVYLGLLCFSSFCLVSNVASISWAVMLLFVLCCVQCCQYILGCYASLRSVLCPILPVYLGFTTSLELWCSCCSFRLIILSCVQYCQYILGSQPV